jgi:hypothetical protein
MSVYSTEPVKNNKGDKPVKSPTTTNGNNPLTETKTVSYSVTSDFYYQNRGTLIDPDTGKRLTAADFYKKILSGTAGLVYNTLLLITIEGKVAQITLNGGRVVASTVSLAADDVSIVNAFALSLTTLIGKPSFATYEATDPLFEGVKKKLLEKGGPVSAVAGQAVGVWQSAGQSLHSFYHSGPALHLGKPHLNKAGEAHYPFTMALGGLLATSEAAASKTIFAKNIIPYKKEYAGWTKGTDGVNQTFLENGKYSSTDPENSLTLNIRRDFEFNNRKKEGLVFGAAAFGVVEKQKIDNTRLVPMMLGDSRTTEQKLQSFVTRFEDKKSKNIWIERLDRIFQPEMYANYDKAKKELKSLTKGKTKDQKLSAAVQFFIDVTIGDITKSLEKIGKGYSGASKLDAGIDYNYTFVNLLAAYKTDLEAAGGTFTIQPNGTFSIKTPPPPLTQSETPVTTLSITTNSNAGVSGKSGTSQVVMGSVQVRLKEIKGNEPAIWKLINDSNKSAFRDAYANFKINNPTLVKGKWNKDILPFFYEANPKFAPAEFNRQRGIRSGDAARAKIYANPSGKDR